ncbi:Putative multidrug export ATP-binding/permease protein SAV1866 [Anaerotruncus sp. 2789STDY5834896]|uniref:Putative multidrug export ATP-binding/permease protein SAV1866 n=1 Tax=uncultured Anaerotruncus sp. TaxID=905011 RepID=A0A1C6GNL9_9FIRM|nr:Putative multidrug export ATP-binding/permease protein SAV1866 [uncultured Anaerotruncus sp.]
MIGKIQHIYALTERGAKDLVKATLWTVAANLSLMLPIGLLIMALQDIIDALMSGGDPAAEIWSITALGAGLLVLIYIVHWFQYKALYIATYIESANRRIGLGEKLRQLPLSFFGQRDLSDLTATMMSDCSALEQAFSHFVPQLWGTIISTVLIAIGMLTMDWRMGLAVLWVLPVAFLLTAGSRWLQDRFGTRNFLAKRAATDSLQELLETVKDIKACNQKEKYLHGLDEKMGEAERATVRSELVTGTCVTSAQAFLKLGLATTVLVGVNLLVGGSLELATLLIYLIAASRLYDPISTTLANMAAVFSSQIKIQRMREIEQQPVQTGTKSYTLKNYDIAFDRVKFAYDQREGVLADVSFTARQGEVTALVGPSGGGKSTAAKLAARFWDVDGGRITLGGVDVSTVEPEALLKNYAIVFQDVVLFRDTVMENIRLGRRDASDQEVLAAARAAQCDTFVQKMPEGYQTMIGENGATLSGGERQRISIARALLKNAPVILLDEATASLDVENESAVQAALSGLVQDKTVLIIAHRMRTVMGADKVVVLAGGKVAEMGCPEDLVKKGGIFAHMVALQTQSQSWSLPGSTKERP